MNGPARTSVPPWAIVFDSVTCSEDCPCANRPSPLSDHALTPRRVAPPRVCTASPELAWQIEFRMLDGVMVVLPDCASSQARPLPPASITTYSALDPERCNAPWPDALDSTMPRRRTELPVPPMFRP